MEIEARIRERMPLETYQEALLFLDSYALALHPRLREHPKLEQMEGYLAYLGNPQKKIRILHVAGTSGKGSTSTMLARILQTTGVRVGLVISPHLMDIRERIQVDGRLISPERFLTILNRQLPVLHWMQESGHGLLSYLGLLLAMSICFFEEEGVEYAVLETGIGGRFDLTNAIHGKDKVALLTKIGFDHMGFLGDTLAKIAWEKAGIIPEGGVAFTIGQDPAVMQVFEEEARIRHAQLLRIHKQTHIQIHSVSEQGTCFDIQTPVRRWERLRLGLIGEHQTENASLALAAFEYVVERDHLSFDERAVRSVLENLSFEGRGEVLRYEGKTIFFDVAHNPQKMQALCSMVRALWSSVEPCVVVAFGHDAQSEPMLRILRSTTNELVLTDFVVGEGEYRYKFKDVDFLEEIAKKEGFTLMQGAVTADDAWGKALASKQEVIVVTGSLHFVAVMKASLLADKKNTM